MIDLETKTIHVGHGDVAVGLYGVACIALQNISDPRECGTSIEEEAKAGLIGPVLPLRFNLPGLEEFRNLLDQVTAGEINAFEFAGYTFSFQPNSEASVNVLRDKVDLIAQLMSLRDKYIPASYLLSCLEEQGAYSHCGVDYLLDAPVATAEPFRYGRWLPPVIGKLGCLCSACNKQADNKFDFCPNCGAQMSAPGLSPIPNHA